MKIAKRSGMTWLHISDLHFRKKTQFNDEIVQNAFLKDLQKNIEEKRLEIDLVLVTGDIAFSGRSDEYKFAADFFDQILAITSLPKERLCLVPGNHDVDRSSITGVFATNVSSLLNSRDTVTTLLTDPIECRQVCRRVDGYTDFIASYQKGSFPQGYLNQDPFYYVHTQFISDRKIAVIGLNTGWLCAGENDKNNLIIGDKQVRDVIENSRDADIKIALLHHPFDWLKEFDNNDVQSVLEFEVDFILRGHLHKSRIDLSISPDAKVIQIAAGALCETRQSPNAYNIVNFDIEANRGTIFLRRYSDEAGGFFSKDTLTYRNVSDGEYSFFLNLQHYSSASSSTSSVEQLFNIISSRLLKQAGNRRTAYPTDMNFRELFDNDIYISPQFKSPNPSNTYLVNVEEVVAQISTDNNVLVMGDPGAGKSFFSYLLQRLIKQGDPKNISRVCLPIDLRIFIDVIGKLSSLKLEDILHVLWENCPGEDQFAVPTYKSDLKITFIIDGIDELSGNTAHIITISNLLSSLEKLGNFLVTCRTRDFEYIFAPYLEPSLFDTICKIKEWDVDIEFVNFIRKLEKKGHLISDGFVDIVKNSVTLRTLASRPLHARMLTFVSSSSFKEVENVAELYANYLHKYATVVDSNLLKEGCLRKAETYLLWREIAWYAFQSNMFIFDKVPLKPVSGFLVNQHKIQPGCISRILQPLFNYVEVFQNTQIQFVHYSFFEFLVAENMADSLLRSYLSNSVEIYQFFSKDMTPEIRHYLIAIINQIKPAGFGKWLSEGYAAINRAAPNQVRREVANNLLVYILGRLNEDVSNELWSLLRSEKDDFLRTCLYWGLGGVGNLDAVKEYLEVLTADVNMRNINRGYLLYYYSDIERSKEPPYFDNDSTRSWTNTKLQTLQFKSKRVYYQKVPVARRIIDVYTFYDFCIFRNEKLSGLESSILQNVLRDLEKEVEDKEIILKLNDMHTQVVLQFTN